MNHMSARTLSQLGISLALAGAMVVGFVALGGVGSGALARGSYANSTRTGAFPGWGCGDMNHTHTGPPGLHLGQTTSPCSRTETGTHTASARTTGQVKHQNNSKHGKGHNKPKHGKGHSTTKHGKGHSTTKHGASGTHGKRGKGH